MNEMFPKVLDRIYEEQKLRDILQQKDDNIMLRQFELRKTDNKYLMMLEGKKKKRQIGEDESKNDWKIQ